MAEAGWQRTRHAIEDEAIRVNVKDEAGAEWSGTGTVMKQSLKQPVNYLVTEAGSGS